MTTELHQPDDQAGDADLALRHSVHGPSTFYGIMYLVNNSDGTCAGLARPRSGLRGPRLRDAAAARACYGALVADGAGCVLVGSNSLNMKFDPNVFNGVTSYGTVGLVQNTWRELKAGS